MQNIENIATGELSEQKLAGQARCPVHGLWSWQKTARVPEIGLPAVERDEQGVWHVRSFAMARAILRSGDTKQAGFNAELIAQVRQIMHSPILYLEGKEHNQQRKMSARFFAPKFVSEHYRSLMEQQTCQLIQRLKRNKQADLSQMSLILAVRVAGQVVGLTNSFPGLAQRLEAFFDFGSIKDPQHDPFRFLHVAQNQSRLMAFYLLDVLPAIRARRRQPQQDVISHLVGQGYSNLEILTECVTYAAAGMITTREFISIAALHLLEQPELRAHYLASSEEERYKLLHEILRLEPVVAGLYRRATADLTIDSDGTEVAIPQGEKVKVHIYAANEDERVVGEYPLGLCPTRQMKDESVPDMVMSFGDGIHRCPGAFIAIQETDIFLQHLLALDNLRIVSKPAIRWNEPIEAYEVRDFLLSLD
jgi:cytochrome P450